MDHDKKETVGKFALDLMNKPQENSDTAEQSKQMLSGYEKNFSQAFERGRAQFGGSFYIVVLVKKEQLLQNVLRCYFIVRESCPTPNHDQKVYRYDVQEKSITLLWVIPCKQACEHFRDSPLNVPIDHRDLLVTILSFYDGSLKRKCKLLNSEIKESTVSQSFAPEKFNHHENLIIQS